MSIERGLYRHYKGGLYFVHGVVKHTELNETLVHYESVETGEEWVRPLAMFTEMVKKTPRFKRIEGSRFFKGKGYWDWVKETEYDDPDVDIVSDFKYHTGTNHIETELRPNSARED